MKYTNSPVAFLCFFLGVTLTSFIPIVSADDNDRFDCTDYVPEKPIDNYQLKTVGVSNLDTNQDQEDKPSPVRVYLNKGGMTVHLFYEGHPEHVLDTNLVDVTLYAASDASGLEPELDECTELKNGEACPPGEINPGFGSYCSVARVDNQCVAEYCSQNEQCQSESCVSNECRSTDRRRLDDRSVTFDSISPTAGIASSFKGEDEVLKRRHSLFAASDASGVSSGRRRMDDRSVTFDSVSPTAGIASGVSSDRRRLDDRSVTFDSVSPTAGIASSFKGEDEVLKRRLDSGGEDCTPCDTTTVIEVSGTAFKNLVSSCYADPSDCPENVPIECWDTSKVTDMSYAFLGTASFNNDSINCWTVERVTDMAYMFYGATDFNQSLNDWNVERVTKMANMFWGATVFNQSLNDWNVIRVNNMQGMFYGANNFNQCLSSWASKAPIDVNVRNTFLSTSCPNTMAASNSPWCQGEDEQCIAPSESPSISLMPPPCGENGVALPATLYDVTLVSYNNDDNYNGFFTQMDASQCFPRTTNGVVAQAEIIMTENPLDVDSYLASLIYDESAGTNNGLLQFCARIAYLIDGDDDKELISYIDTKVVLDVSIAADIEFTQAVDISSDQTTVNTVNQDVLTVIDVDSFLCGDPGENDGAPYGDAYSLGQSFRVCVDVKAADRGKFGLTNFKDVTCSTDSGSETIIISLVNDVATAASILTTLFDNEATVGAKSIASGNPSTQIEASERAISFSTVVTNAYFIGDDDTLTCGGSVDVDTVTQRRQLVSFTVPNPVSSSLSAGRRQMEEDTGAIAGAVEFGATIKLSSSSAASGRFSPMTTDGIMGFLLVIGVGPMMMMMMW